MTNQQMVASFWLKFYYHILDLESTQKFSYGVCAHIFGFLLSFSVTDSITKGDCIIVTHK